MIFRPKSLVEYTEELLLSRRLDQVRALVKIFCLPLPKKVDRLKTFPLNRKD